MKNNFFVFIEIVVCLVIVYLCVIAMFVWFAVTSFGDDITVSIVLTVMLLILPIIIIVYIVYECAAKIYLDETGMTKRLFGIRLKYYKWEEIDHIKFYGNPKFVTSISFYKKRDEKKLFYRFYKYERIYFSCNKKKMDILTFYAPENIKQQLGID